jgi:hypothetical protein
MCVSLALDFIRLVSPLQMITMAALAVACIVHWATKDPHSTILKQNWALRPGSVRETASALFYGVCVAFLGVTGKT